eukprot:131230_1
MFALLCFMVISYGASPVYFYGSEFVSYTGYEWDNDIIVCDDCINCTVNCMGLASCFGIDVYGPKNAKLTININEDIPQGMVVYATESSILEVNVYDFHTIDRIELHTPDNNNINTRILCGIPTTNKSMTPSPVYDRYGCARGAKIYSKYGFDTISWTLYNQSLWPLNYTIGIPTSHTSINRMFCGNEYQHSCVDFNIFDRYYDCNNKTSICYGHGDLIHSSSIVSTWSSCNETATTPSPTSSNDILSTTNDVSSTKVIKLYTTTKEPVSKDTTTKESISDQCSDINIAIMNIVGVSSADFIDDRNLRSFITNATKYGIANVADDYGINPFSFYTLFTGVTGSIDITERICTFTGATLEFLKDIILSKDDVIATYIADKLILYFKDNDAVSTDNMRVSISFSDSASDTNSNDGTITVVIIIIVVVSLVCVAVIASVLYFKNIREKYNEQTEGGDTFVNNNHDHIEMNKVEYGEGGNSDQTGDIDQVINNNEVLRLKDNDKDVVDAINETVIENDNDMDVVKAINNTNIDENEDDLDVIETINETAIGHSE